MCQWWLQVFSSICSICSHERFNHTRPRFWLEFTPPRITAFLKCPILTHAPSFFTKSHFVWQANRGGNIARHRWRRTWIHFWRFISKRGGSTAVDYLQAPIIALDKFLRAWNKCWNANTQSTDGCAFSPFVNVIIPTSLSTSILSSFSA